MSFTDFLIANRNTLEDMYYGMSSIQWEGISFNDFARRKYREYNRAIGLTESIQN